ncbi:uncharacterized protein LOC130272584 [Hyla sarda]|uniref:uncharacterized protein LOC130272584 n=1 Tax=Hyla sarda TaxID=327740 RepID=UPI0024C436F4|nr:uncharacterized protein LOC130272584 [Hyla sarda]
MLKLSFVVSFRQKADNRRVRRSGTSGSCSDLLQCSWDVREELKETKKSLKRHFEEESKQIVFRSKVENLEKGDKCNSFFFRKLHAGHTPLTELRDETGHMRRGKEEVMGVNSDFYSNLYAPKSSDPEAAERFLSGVRQGCPLSSLQLFAKTIRQNGEIRGITAPGPDHYEVKCSLYMNDETVFCADQRSVTALVQTCEDFGRASGEKVNCGKSEAMLFGEWHLASSAPFPFTVKPDFI